MEVRTATSFVFYMSIPQNWAVKELLRVSKRMEKENDDFKDLPPHRKVSKSLTELMNINPVIPFRQVYGLAAVQLERYSLLKEARSFVCALIQAPGDKYDLGKVISNNHRYFQVDGHFVDPLVEHYQQRGHDVRRHDVYRIDPYPTSVAKGILGRAGNDSFNVRRWEETDPHQAWFLQTARRLARRMTLTQDWWCRKDRKGVKDRRGFEGYMRALVPRMVDESEDNWKGYLSVALQTEFPGWPGESVGNFVSRITQEFGPPPPRTHYRQQKKIKMVDPDTSYIHPSSFI